MNADVLYAVIGHSPHRDRRVIFVPSAADSERAVIVACADAADPRSPFGDFTYRAAAFIEVAEPHPLNAAAALAAFALADADVALATYEGEDVAEESRLIADLIAARDSYRAAVHAATAKDTPQGWPAPAAVTEMNAVTR